MKRDKNQLSNYCLSNAVTYNSECSEFSVKRCLLLIISFSVLSYLLLTFYHFVSHFSRDFLSLLITKVRYCVYGKTCDIQRNELLMVEFHA